MVYDISLADSKKEPGKVVLKQVYCYPHPSPKGVTISFTINQRVPVWCVITDCPGRDLAVIYRTSEIGENRLTWNGCNQGGIRQPPGRYYVRLRAGKAAAILPLLKLK
jgi:hypothetical protein